MEASCKPRRVYLKLYDENTVWTKQSPGCCDGLERVDIVIDADIRVVRTRGVRIQQRKDNQVKLFLEF